MKEPRVDPIPSPLKWRVREWRVRGVPVLVFGAALLLVVSLWKEHVATPAIVGQVVSNPEGIRAFMPASIVSDPKVGMQVEVRTRGAKRETGRTEIVNVGAGMEPVPRELVLAAVNGAEMGLPIRISLPANLSVRSGELVDITFPAGTRSR